MNKNSFIHIVFCLTLMGAASSLSASDAIKVGTIAGTVLAQVTQQPIEGAAVRVEGSELSALCDSTGRFRIENVPIGSNRLLITREGFLSAIVTDVIVTAGRETSIVTRLQEAVHLNDEVTVKASSFARPEGVTTGAFAMSYEEVRRAPGAFGDVSRMVQSLPATIGRDDQRNDIVARGGSPSENLILVDNIEVPNISHFAGQGATGGPIAMLNAETISDVSFLAGGFPAAYGNRLSSVLEVRLREGNRDRHEAEFDLSMAGAGLLVEGPLGRRGSWLVCARRSFVDLIAEAYGLTTVPQYANYQAKAIYDLSSRHKLTFISLGGWDKINFDVDESDLDDPNMIIVDDAGWRGVAGLNWQALLGDDGFINLSIGHSENDFKLDAWDARLNGQLIERNRSRERETTIRKDITYRVERLGSVNAGAFLKRLGTSFDYALPLGQESVYSTDSHRINRLTLDEHIATWQTGGYLELRPRIGAWATATIGGRFEHYQLNDASEASPRAGLTFHLRHNLDLSASYGRYYQNPALIFMKAHPDNALLRPIRSDHYVTGLAFYPRPDTKITVEGYYKRYFRYPVSTQYPSISGANTGEQYNLSFYMMPYVSQGRGKSAGVELYLQQKLSGRVWGQASYAYSRTENRALDGIWRPSTFDLPHVLSLVAGLKAGRNLELSTKFTYTSGRPVTPLLPESYEQNRLIFDLARVNAERAPAYHRLDLRIDRRHAYGWGNLIFYLELDNVYNRKNVRYYDWNPKKREREAISQVSFMAIGGVNVEF